MNQKTETFDTLQERLDELRLFQSLHHIRVARLTALLKSRPQNPGEIRDELAAHNDQMEQTLAERKTIEAKMRDITLQRREKKERQDNIRQIICGIVSNPNYHKDSDDFLAARATAIENDIQAFTR